MIAVNTICVCGAGTMGSGIAQVAAQAGFTTIQFDVNEQMLEKSRNTITANLSLSVQKGRLSEAEKMQVLERLSFTAQRKDCVADLIIEAIIEKPEAKIALFTELAGYNKPTVVFATNTSSIPVHVIAAGLQYPEQLAGMHFFNPAPLMKLVEVIRSEQTTDEVTELVAAIAKRMGKTPVICKDAPGFIVNRVARHYYLEAMRMVEQGIATIENVDAVMEASGFKMGPFRLMDLIGMDINYSVSNIVWEALGKPERLTPSVLQKSKVDANELGRKSGKGFYSYKSQSSK
ncbi:3-hydroxyacyl-CoA dehydrogenase family protein [Sediminibacterium ginsengisoli]|uniref:3-hydroxybutyryl-CoA dehydrogenase n=1 Tax=Sediminibacterium ginsengisoli TaxID=413434 RepID=A0A1T4M577_9BACT|nr:3-hydroxyacyl-CoA dehydrogenase NAD-binding domain-containing protein [Sediminibacterium ginsengisoli]SJZ62082.1 3-hydroxybutyryl-CoA dehydrogenase [Sediminibacterium ginsengisoli]